MFLQLFLILKMEVWKFTAFLWRPRYVS